MAKDEVIALKNVSKIYGMGEIEIKALDDIDLSIRERICLLGPL